MRKIWFSILAITLLLSIFVSGRMIQSASAEETLLAYWKFDEGDGDIAYDSSGNGNDGILYGGLDITGWTDGMYGKALLFDGVDDYVEVPDDASLRPYAFSVETWIKGDKPGALDTWQHIVSKHERYDGTPFRGYVLQVNELRLGFSLGIVSAWSHIVALETYETGVWYHLMGTWDGVTQKFYINGTLQGSATPRGFEHTTYALRFGRRSEDIDPPRIYAGIIDEVRIERIPYNVAIDAYCYTEAAAVSVGITMDGTPTGYNTPHTFTGLTGTHTFTVPSNDPSGHPFKQWSTGSTSTTITVNSGGTYTAYYGETPQPPPVGGVLVPVDKFGLLAPYIGLVSTLIFATVATAIYVKRVKRRKEKR